jgi:hypothetical protein
MHKRNTHKRNTHKRKTHKRNTHKRKSKGGASGRTFRRNLCTIRQLSRQNRFPPEISALIEAGYSQNVIERYLIKYREKMRLKRDFIALPPGGYDPREPELVNLTRRATQILNRNDLNHFWKTVLAEIYMGLYQWDPQHPLNHFNESWETRALYAVGEYVTPFSPPGSPPGSPLGSPLGHPNDSNPDIINYNQTKQNFEILIKIFFNYDLEGMDYLIWPPPDFLYENFIREIM